MPILSFERVVLSVRDDGDFGKIHDVVAICRLAFCGGCHTSLLELATPGARLGEIEFAPQGKVGGFLA